MAVRRLGGNVQLLGRGLLRLDGRLAWDDYARSDGQLGGLAPSGQPYVAGNAQVASNGVRSLDVFTTMDVGSADYTIQMTVGTVDATSSHFPQFAVRYVDINNHLHLQENDGTHYLLEKRVSGTYTAVQSIALSPTTGDVIKIKLSGSTVTCFVNGVQQFSGSVTGISTTSTLIAWGGSSAANTGTWKNLNVVAN